MRAGCEVVAGVGASMVILDCSFRIDRYDFSWRVGPLFEIANSSAVTPASPAATLMAINSQRGMALSYPLGSLQIMLKVAYSSLC